jgi:hypothetical protein
MHGKNIIGTSEALTGYDVDFDIEKQRLKKAFEYILPEKSSYEI